MQCITYDLKESNVEALGISDGGAFHNGWLIAFMDLVVG